MTVITRKPENRLARTIWSPGGKTVEKALEDANEALESVREERLLALKAKLAEIQTVGRGTAKGASLRDLHTLYGLSSDVLDIAGVFGLPELGEAAYSLCELLDGLGSRKAWNWPAVEVHLNGLLLLSDPANAPPQARQAIVDGLRLVCERMARRQGEAPDGSTDQPR